MTESRSEIVGGLVVAVLVLVVPKLVGAIAGVSIDVPLIAVPIVLAALCVAFLISRAIRWARAVSSRIQNLEAEAAAHSDSLEFFEQTISLADAIRAAESRGWKVKVTKSESGIHHEMVCAYGDARGEMRIGGGIDFAEDEADKRRPEDNEQLLASMILSTARRHKDPPFLVDPKDADGGLDRTIRALPRRSG